MARIHRIVRDLSSFSHIDDDGNAQVNVNGAVESALTMLRNELKYRAHVERDLRATKVVRANSARVGQVFLNLIMNAAQALDEASISRNMVIVRSYDDGPCVVIEVRDNGPGIPAEVLPRIFDSFFTTKPRGVGTGLGLPISQGIVRSMGGELTVESRVGEGATFRVRLPATGVVSEPISVVAPAPGHRQSYARRRVLAVDDEALLLKAYKRMLAESHDVQTALGGEEALRLLERTDGFEVILCDLQMPDMSGMELFADVQRRFPDLADRFVFVTGGAFSPEAKLFLEEVGPPVIHKPFHIEEVLDLIERQALKAGPPERAQVAAPRRVLS
jgi:CheY-like chemotaxis protein